MMGRRFKPTRRMARPQQGSLQRSWRAVSWMTVCKTAAPETRAAQEFTASSAPAAGTPARLR